MITVRVPCSTSNLGPGFDCLGLALDLALEVTIEVTESSRDAVTRIGDPLFRAVPDAQDLVLQSMRTRWLSRGSMDRSVSGVFRSEIPTARGLGSSAAAVVGGVMAADALDHIAHDPVSVLTAAARIEGHPDNVAPSVLGGLCCAFQDEHHVRAMRLGDLRGVVAVVASPDTALATRASRAVLPRSVTHGDAARSVGRAVYLSHALSRGEFGDLAWAFEDVLHQPHRAVLLPGLQQALVAARAAGAIGAALSGAGSSAVALVIDDTRVESVSAALRTAYQAVGVHVVVRALGIAASGAAVHAQ